MRHTALELRGFYAYSRSSSWDGSDRNTVQRIEIVDLAPPLEDLPQWMRRQTAKVVQVRYADDGPEARLWYTSTREIRCTWEQWLPLRDALIAEAERKAELRREQDRKNREHEARLRAINERLDLGLQPLYVSGHGRTGIEVRDPWSVDRLLKLLEGEKIRAERVIGEGAV